MEVSKINKTFQALSDHTRMEIIELLRINDLTAGEIAQHFDISRPSISHHLSVLKNADLILDERKGQYIYYSLNTSVVDDVIAWLVKIFGKEEK